MKILPGDATPQTLYAGFEGGAVYTQERNGRYLVVLDEGTLADMLPPDELAGLALVKTLEFATRAERTAYLLRRFGPPQHGRRR